MQIQRYVGRISGPLLDRIDIHIDVPAVRFQELSAGAAGRRQPEDEGSAEILAHVVAARDRQLERLRGDGVFANAQMSPRQIRKHSQLDAEGERVLEAAMTRLGLSARAYDRILKVSRTVADLAGSDDIRPRTWPRPSATARSTARIGLKNCLPASRLPRGAGKQYDAATAARQSLS